jgi:hypothetical protein
MRGLGGEVILFFVMPGLVPGIHDFRKLGQEDVDGRAKGRLRPSSTDYARP